MISPVLVTAGKIALVLFITVAVAVLIGTYIWRRCHGVRPWRPPNSRIIGYDAPIPQIEQPPRAVFPKGKLPLTVSPPPAPRAAGVRQPDPRQLRDPAPESSSG